MAATTDERPRLSTLARVVLGIATVCFVAVALRQAWTDGVTYDESFAMYSGLAGLTRHDLRATPEHPPLGKTLAAIPLLLLHPDIPRGKAWANGDGGTLAGRFVHRAYVEGHLQRDVFVARIVPILETVAIGWLIAMLATALFGSNAGLVAGLLWLANPFVLGIGHIDGIDMPAALTTVVTALAVLYARRDPTRKRIVIVGLCAGVAVLARVTGLLVVATAALALMTPLWREQRREAVWRAALIASTAWLTVMAAYALLSPVDILGHGPPLHAATSTIGNLVVPPAWLRGTSYLLHDGNNPGPSFLLGLQHTGSWPLFVPGSLFVKLPPTTLAVLVLGPLAWMKLPRAARRDAAMVVAVPAIAHTLFTMQQARPIGLRYELPGLALALVAASAMVHALTPRVRRAFGTVVVGVGAVACTAGPALAWTNPLLGPGYRQAADSNLDWGEAFPALARWSPSHHPWVEVFSSPGLGNAAVPGARDLTSAPTTAPITGWVAVSASQLTVYDRHDLAWLRAYCPVRVLDGSILVYRFASPPDRQAAGPESPAPPCAGGTSVRLDASAGESGS